MDESLKSIELFAGAAGLGLATEHAGIKPLEVVEWNKDCRNTIMLNRDSEARLLKSWPNEIQRDIRGVDFERFEGLIDIVSGGPPCQPFSMGGKHKAQADERDMFPEAVRAVRQSRPKAFIFENVRGLTRDKFKTYFEYITLQMRHPQVIAKNGEDWSEHLSRLQGHHTGHSDNSDDYRVVTQVLNAADYGVPQQRHRVFFVGISADLGLQFSFPGPTHCKEKLVESILSGTYQDKHRVQTNRLSFSPQIQRSMKNASNHMLSESELKAWKTVRDVLSDLPEPKVSGDKNIPNHLLRKGARSYAGHTGSPVDAPAKALKAGVHGVPGGENMLRKFDGTVRYFSVRESARLQTFPDDYIFSGSWSEAMRQLGNAVPVKLGEAVTKSVVSSLSSSGI